VGRPPIERNHSFSNRPKHRLSRRRRSVQVGECTEREDEVDTQQETRIVVGRVGGVIIERVEPPDKIGFLEHRPVIVELFEVDVNDSLRKLAIAREIDVE